MKMKELMEKTGLDRETIRFYENKGLISPAKRTINGYRIYSEESLSRFNFIKEAKSSGFTLAQIAELLNFKDKRISCSKGRDIALSKIDELERNIQAMKAMKNRLLKFVSACESKGEKGLSSPCSLSFQIECLNRMPERSK